MTSQERFYESEQLINRALSINRAQGIRLAGLTFHLARVLGAQGKYPEAQTLYDEALSRQEQAHGSKAPEVALTLEEYAKVLNEVKSTAQARQMEFRARQIR